MTEQEDQRKNNGENKQTRKLTISSSKKWLPICLFVFVQDPVKYRQKKEQKIIIKTSLVKTLWYSWFRPPSFLKSWSSVRPFPASQGSIIILMA